MKNAGQHPELLDEDRAIREALTHFEDLDFKGGAIVMDGRVEAFSLGEVLNPETAVIHIEKANPGISGLYAAINQRFCQEFWAGLPFVNREQDLGRPGLRKATLRPPIFMARTSLALIPRVRLPAWAEASAYAPARL
jgi:hypothetical protein